METLPDEQLAEILSHMRCPKSLCRAACVSRRFRSSADMAFWYLCKWTERIADKAEWLAAKTAQRSATQRATIPKSHASLGEAGPSCSNGVAPGQSSLSGVDPERDGPHSGSISGVDPGRDGPHSGSESGQGNESDMGILASPAEPSANRINTHLAQGTNEVEGPSSSTGTAGVCEAREGMESVGGFGDRTMDSEFGGGVPGGVDLGDAGNGQENTVGNAKGRDRTTGSLSWRHIFFSQTFALQFNGINDYVELPQGLLPACAANDAITVEVVFMAYPLPASRADDTSTMIQGGGVLLACQNREFGRTRRAQRLGYLPLMYVGREGELHGGFTRNLIMRAGQNPRPSVMDGKWHRATLVAHLDSGVQRLYLDGRYQEGALPSDPLPIDLSDRGYLMMGNGITEGFAGGGAVPIYNAHPLYGCIDEVRTWDRCLSQAEVEQYAWKRLGMGDEGAEGLRVCYSLTEGVGNVINNHMRSSAQLPAGPPGPRGWMAMRNAVGALPVGFGTEGRLKAQEAHAYFTPNGTGRVSAFRHEHTAKLLGAGISAVTSKGPTWLLSTAPVRGEVRAAFSALPQEEPTW